MTDRLTDEHIKSLCGDLAEAAGKAGFPPSICDRIQALQDAALERNALTAAERRVVRAAMRWWRDMNAHLISRNGPTFTPYIQAHDKLKEACAALKRGKK